MPPFDLVRSILFRAHVQSCPYSPSQTLPTSGPPIPGSRPADVYDPVVPQYQDASPLYEPPSPWFAGVPISGTPSQHPTNQFDTEVSPDQIQYSDALMDQQLHNALMQAVVDDIAAAAAFAVVQEGVTPDAPPEPHPAPELVQPDPVAVANAVFDYQMQVIASMTEPPTPEQPEPSMQLEQIVEQGFQQMMDPAGIVEPPDMMMTPGMPMDPFGPMPPGLGPM